VKLLQKITIIMCVAQGKNCLVLEQGINPRSTRPSTLSIGQCHHTATGADYAKTKAFPRSCDSQTSADKSLCSFIKISGIRIEQSIGIEYQDIWEEKVSPSTSVLAHRDE